MSQKLDWGNRRSLYSAESKASAGAASQVALCTRKEKKMSKPKASCGNNQIQPQGNGNIDHSRNSTSGGLKKFSSTGKRENTVLEKVLLVNSIEHIPIVQLKPNRVSGRHSGLRNQWKHSEYCLNGVLDPFGYSLAPRIG